MRGTAGGAPPRRARPSAGALLLLVALTLAACATDDGAAGVPTATPSPPEATEPAAGEPEQADDDEGAGTEPHADAGPRVDNLLEGISEPARVHYEVDAPGGVDSAVVAYDAGRFALEAGERLVLGEVGRGLTACGALGDAECVRLDDEALAEVGDGVVPAGLAPILATVRAAVDPATSAAGAAQGRARIAERHARCAALEADSVDGLEAERALVCVDRESGSILRWEVDQPGIGTTTLDATRVGTPRPGDFDPPSEPIDPLESPELEGPGVDDLG